MCYHNYNSRCHSYGFCDFLRELFTPVNPCYGYTASQTNACVQARNNRNVGCQYSCVRRCPCCGQVLAENTNVCGQTIANTNVCAQTTTNVATEQTGFGCCQRQRYNGCYYMQYGCGY